MSKLGGFVDFQDKKWVEERGGFGSWEEERKGIKKKKDRKKRGDKRNGVGLWGFFVHGMKSTAACVVDLPG